MLKVLSKSLATIYPERQKIETTELRTKITEAYHQSKVGSRKMEFDSEICFTIAMF